MQCVLTIQGDDHRQRTQAKERQQVRKRSNGIGIVVRNEHPQRVSELRRIALDAMQALEQFSPYLTGPVYKGTAGPYAEIELQLFPESVKEVEIFLLDRRVAYTTAETRRFSGDRVHAVSVLALLWQEVPLKLSVFDPRDERVALKTTQAGRVLERAGIAEVEALLRDGDRPA